METKNNVVVVLLIVLISICSGIGLLFGINNAVSVAVAPLYMKLSEVQLEQKDLGQKLEALGLKNLDQKLSSIEKQLSSMANKTGQGAPPPQMPTEDYNKVYTIDVGNSVVMGKKDAPVTIIEFSDFQCPFCSRFYSVIKEVMNAYPDQVNLIVKNFPLPFHPNARPAAKLALAANEQGKYREMMEALMENGGDASEAKIKEYATKIGLDLKKLTDDFKNKDAQWEKQIQEDMQWVEKADVHGTPTFFINGKKTQARDVNGFKAEIDKILAGAKK